MILYCDVAHWRKNNNEKSCNLYIFPKLKRHLINNLWTYHNHVQCVSLRKIIQWRPDQGGWNERWAKGFEDSILQMLFALVHGCRLQLLTHFANRYYRRPTFETCIVICNVDWVIVTSATHSGVLNHAYLCKCHGRVEGFQLDHDRYRVFTNHDNNWM